MKAEISQKSNILLERDGEEQIQPEKLDVCEARILEFSPTSRQLEAMVDLLPEI